MARDTATPDSSPDKRDRRAKTGRAAVEQTVNTLSPTPVARAPEPHEPPVGARETTSPAQPTPAERRGSAPETTSKDETLAGFAAVPDRILDRYYRIGTKYYLDNGELAFTHHSDRLTTPSENSEIARDLVEIARHNGIHDITVTGTERFRREVWAAATRLGVEVRGYEPTLHDEKQLVRAMAREDAARRGIRDEGRGAVPESDGSPAATARAAAPPGTGPSTRDGTGSPPAVGGPGADAPRVFGEGGVASDGHAARAGRAAGDRRAASEGRTYAGELLDHGPEHYQRNPREDMSYYVQVGTANGAVDLWGLDLKRALAEAKSRPRIGDRVVLRQTGQRDVTVRTREFDEAGRFLGERDKDTHRNRWSIEKEDFVRERARLAAVLRDEQVSAERGARAHPLGLVSVRDHLRAAAEFAARRIAHPEDRERFVAAVRKALEGSKERVELVRAGEPGAGRAVRPSSDKRAREPEQVPERG